MMPWKYKTMVTAMDRSIGMLLDALEALGEADNTIIVFTSDNGPGTYSHAFVNKRILREY